MGLVHYFLAHESRLTLHSLETLLNGHKHLACAGRFHSFAELIAALPLSDAKAVVINRHLPYTAKGEQTDEDELAAGIETLLLVQPDLRILIDAPTRTERLNPIPLLASGTMGILGSDTTKEEYYKARGLGRKVVRGDFYGAVLGVFCKGLYFGC